MVIHGFGDQGHSRHVSESGDEILALKGAVQLAIFQSPAVQLGHALRYFVFGEFFCRHIVSPVTDLCQKYATGQRLAASADRTAGLSRCLQWQIHLS
jgi:hypothetical protein